MKKVLYTKFSSQRKREFQISTSIIEDNKTKYVEKKALHDEGKKHIQNMREYYNEISSIFAEMGWCVARGESDSPETMKFPFIVGEGLEQILESYIQRHEFEKAELVIKKFIDKFMNNPLLHIFENTTQFEAMFGKVDLGEYTFHAFEYSNVDYVFSNFIVNGEDVTLIDYEWVFLFPIPIEFILYRSVLHSASFQKLPECLKKDIYLNLGIDDRLSGVFYKMECSFQRYTKGDYSDLEEIREKIGNDIFVLDEKGMHMNRFRMYVGNRKIAFNESLQTEHSIQQDIKGMSGDIKIVLNNVNGIYKLCKVVAYKNGEKIICPVKKHNAELQIQDDYYFLSDEPTLEINNNNYDSVQIDYRIIDKNNALLPNLVKCIIKENEEEKRIGVLEQERNQYKESYDLCMKDAQRWQEAYVECSRMLKETQNAFMEYQKAYDVINSELDDIHQRLWWKIDNKIRKGH